MSPDLDALPAALHAKRTCPAREAVRAQATFERLLADALARVPGTSRE